MNLIKTVYINNLYSFKEFNIDLTDKKNEAFKKIYILGKNNVGKTNFLNSIKYFSSLIEDNSRNDIGTFIFPIFDYKKKFIEFEIELSDGEIDYKYFLKINHKDVEIKEEILEWKFSFESENKYKTLFEKNGTSIIFTRDRKLINLQNINNINEINSKEDFKKKLILNILNISLVKIPSNFYHLVTNINFIESFDHFILKKEDTKSNNQRFNTNKNLKYNKNIIRILEKNKKDLENVINAFDFSLKTIEFTKKNNENLEINNTIKKTIKEFSDLSSLEKSNEKKQLKELEEVKKLLKEIKIINNKYNDKFSFNSGNEKYILKFIDHNNHAFAWEELSKGTKKIITLFLTILLAEEQNTILLIDEIDAGINPFLIKSILSDEFVNNKKNTIIFTTHNPEILDNQNINAGQIVFFERDEEEFFTTHYFLSNFPNLRRKEVSTKNLYLKGKLGGVPYVNKIKK